MELHQLRYFVAVAQTREFHAGRRKVLRRAAFASQQIIKLERELGGPVFDRTGRKVRLTDRGRTLYDRAVEILTAVDQAKRALSEEGGIGHVSVGAIPTVGPVLSAPVAQAVLAAISQGGRESFRKPDRVHDPGLPRWRSRRGPLALPVLDERLFVEPLFTEELLLTMAAGHPLAKKRRIVMEDISHEKFVLLSETHCLGEQVMRFCNQQLCQPVVSCHSASC